MNSRLIISFWDICLDNLPQGSFARSTATAAEAREMTLAARANAALLCVCRDDLHAPCGNIQRRHQAELCAVLREAFDIPLRSEDFLSAPDNFLSILAAKCNKPLPVTQLQLARLQPGERMLVVTCGFEFAQSYETCDRDDLFVVAGDSVGFELITATGAA